MEQYKIKGGRRIAVSYTHLRTKASDEDEITEKFSLMRPGRHHIYDALAALALTFAYGGRDEIGIAREALAEFAGAPGRFEIITNENSSIAAICDYAHTPDALENLLMTVKEVRDADENMRHGRIITVFGCGGDRDRGKRPVMGKIAGQLSDYTIITSDNQMCIRDSYNTPT